MSRKKQFIIPVAILAIGAAGFMAFSSMKKPPEEKAKIDNTPIVEVSSVTLASMLMEVSSHGVVQPKYKTELVAQVTGTIVELSDAFVQGGFVKQGQLLARIDPSDYQAALIEAQASLASAKASLEMEKAQGKVAADEWKRIKNTAPTELSLRKPQLAQEMARVKAAQAMVKRAKRNLERTEIRAPYDAMIEARSVGLGSFVSTGSPLGKVLSTSVAEIRLPVADSQLQFLQQQGLNAKVTLTGEFAGKQRQWQARIQRSEGVIDSNSRMSYLVAQVKLPYQQANGFPLKFGAYVNAKIEGKHITNATLVPRHLVVNNRVAVVDQESKLKYVPVEIVRQQGANVVVDHGLHNGDKIITSALDYPIDGMKLALAEQVIEVDTPKPEEKTNNEQLASN